jgi:hypothetical protein
LSESKRLSMPNRAFGGRFFVLTEISPAAMHIP